MQKNNITNKIKELMNEISKKQFSYREVAIIANAIQEEYADRKEKRLDVDTRTQVGRDILNIRIVAIVNKKLQEKKISVSDIQLFKKCRVEEYKERTNFYDTETYKMI